jgi:prophage regulatory protein
LALLVKSGDYRSRTDILEVQGRKESHMEKQFEKKPESPRIIFFPEIKKLTGLSRSTVWKLEKKGLFPQRRLVTETRVGWIESEVLSWIESRIKVETAEGQPKHNLPTNEKDRR